MSLTKPDECGERGHYE